jgi:hypothetical protein
MVKVIRTNFLNRLTVNGSSFSCASTIAGFARTQTDTRTEIPDDTEPSSSGPRTSGRYFSFLPIAFTGKKEVLDAPSWQSKTGFLSASTN